MSLGEAWRSVAMGSISASTTGVAIPVNTNLSTGIDVYMVRVTNTDASIRCHYLEPEDVADTVTETDGAPIKADADANSLFGPRKATGTDPQVASASGTPTVTYTVYERNA